MEVKWKCEDCKKPLLVSVGLLTSDDDILCRDCEQWENITVDKKS